jgi:hypothetical protein
MLHEDRPDFFLEEVQAGILGGDRGRRSRQQKKDQAEKYAVAPHWSISP